MTTSLLKKERRRRFVSSASGYAFALVALLAAALVGAIRIVPQPSPISKSVLSVALWAVSTFLVLLLIAAVIAFFVQTGFECRRRAHDPTWIHKYQEKFDTMTEERFGAARTLIEQKGRLADIEVKRDVLSRIDDVLDFFEDIGFYQAGGQISPETAHHHFYHWLRMYWQAARDYVEAWRKEEPARWDHIDGLFEITSELEMEEGKCSRSAIPLSSNELDECLQEEMKFCGKNNSEDAIRTEPDSKPDEPTVPRT